jgi:isopentenyl diphosphate isomerase/L-lactate dehydrogenase-like FMN-dependent dehydrogenase
MATQYRRLHPNESSSADGAHDRTVTYVAALAIGAVIVMIGRTMLVSASETAAEQSRILMTTLAIALFITSLAALVLVRQAQLVAQKRSAVRVVSHQSDRR